jgi:hypothetical protein
MNERLMTVWLSDMGYSEYEIEHKLSEIAEDLNDRARDDACMENDE